MRVTGAVFHTQGSLGIDNHACVIRPGGSPIDNLFAGGGVARGIIGTGLSSYLLGADVYLGQVAGNVAGALVYHPLRK